MEYIEAQATEEYLHVISVNYNWGDGFRIPEAILQSPHCTLSTALSIFYGCDGFRYLNERLISSDSDEWLAFVDNLYHCILKDTFPNGGIAFQTPLTKVQIFKLKKQLSAEEIIFITDFSGSNFDCPL